MTNLFKSTTQKIPNRPPQGPYLSLYKELIKQVSILEKVYPQAKADPQVWGLMKRALGIAGRARHRLRRVWERVGVDLGQQWEIEGERVLGWPREVLGQIQRQQPSLIPAQLALHGPQPYGSPSLALNPHLLPIDPSLDPSSDFFLSSSSSQDFFSSAPSQETMCTQLSVE